MGSALSKMKRNLLLVPLALDLVNLVPLARGSANCFSVIALGSALFLFAAFLLFSSQAYCARITATACCIVGVAASFVGLAAWMPLIS
jgi:hypothetical protein